MVYAQHYDGSRVTIEATQVNVKDEKGYTPLLRSVWCGSTAVTAVLLATNECDITSSNHQACMSQHAAVLPSWAAACHAHCTHTARTLCAYFAVYLLMSTVDNYLLMKYLLKSPVDKYL